MPKPHRPTPPILVKRLEACTSFPPPRNKAAMKATIRSHPKGELFASPIWSMPVCIVSISDLVCMAMRWRIRTGMQCGALSLRMCFQCKRAGPKQAASLPLTWHTIRLLLEHEQGACRALTDPYFLIQVRSRQLHIAGTSQGDADATRQRDLHNETDLFMPDRRCKGRCASHRKPPWWCTL